MKQNKNSSVIRFLAFVTAFVVFVFSISIPSYAYLDTSVNGLDFSGQPIPVFSSAPSVSQLKESGLCFWSNSSFQYYIGSSVSDTYCAGAYSNNSLSALAVYASSSATYYWIRNDQSYVHTDTMSQTSSGLYYDPLGPSFSLDGFLVPVFSSYVDAVSAVKDWIDNPPSGVASPAVAQFVLPAGNAVVIDLGAWDNSNPDKKIQLSQSTQYVHPQQWSTNQYYAYTDSMPSSISTPFTGQNPINWYGSGKTNLFNQTNSFVANFIYNTSLGRYLVIINPFVPEDHDTDNYNAPISVYVGQCSGYKFYQLKTDVSQIGAFGGQGDGTTGTGVYDPDSGTWTVTNDQTGDVWAPSQGGGNSNNVVSTVSGWLEQISHQISDFFSGAIGAVTNLVSAGSDFIHSLSGLYAWLPAPVYSVLVSALILVITIGVIKVFI